MLGRRSAASERSAGAGTGSARGGTYVSDQLRRLLVAPVEDLLVVVHPDLRQAYLVAGNHLRSFGEAVRALGAKHVTYD